MKKIISIVLCVVLSFSVLCVNAIAADTKTEALLEEIKTTKSYYVDFGDVFYEEEGAPFRDVKGFVKLYEYEDGSKDLKFAATAKLWFFNVKFLISDGEFNAYLPLLSINLNSLLGDDMIFYELLYDMINFYDSLDSDFIDCMKLKSSGEKDTEEYGTVYVEEFVPDMRKMLDYADENGLIEIPEESKLASMTEADIINWLKSLGEKGENVLRMLESNATFYYKSDDLIAFKVTLYDAADDNAILNSEDLMIKRAEAIGSGVPDSAFNKPLALFDITSLFTMLLGSLI